MTDNNEKVSPNTFIELTSFELDTESDCNRTEFVSLQEILDEVRKETGTTKAGISVVITTALRVMGSYLLPDGVPCRIKPENLYLNHSFAHEVEKEVIRSMTQQRKVRNKVLEITKEIVNQKK